MKITRTANRAKAEGEFGAFEAYLSRSGWRVVFCARGRVWKGEDLDMLARELDEFRRLVEAGT